MKSVFQTSHFKKDIKRLGKRGKDIEKLKAVVRILSLGDELDDRHRDHALGGKWTG